MQHIENDMDDLFQRAGENYPLKNSADWESVSKRLGMENKPLTTPSKRKKSRKIIPLLLLLILSGSWFIWHQIATANFQKNNSTDLPKSDLYNASNTNTKNNIVNIAANKQTIANSFLKNKIANNKSLTAYAATNLKSKASRSFYLKSEQKLANSDDLKNNTTNSIIHDSSDDKYFTETRNNKIKERLKINPNEIFQLTENENKKLAEKNKNENVGNKEINNKTREKQKSKGFYAGVVTALDFSKVKAGSFDNTGFDAGFLLGYNINNRLSFETGFMWNKKIYSSAGKDFNMNKVRSTMPAGMIINSLESNSSLAEIPVRVKYNFIHKNNADFFVTAGTSAYIMTKEKNNYNVTFNGNNEKISSVYNKDNYGLPAVANVSVGYEHKISRLLNIRIEPFLKIPLQGIGVGSLPVTSAGLQIAITGHLK
ncbi:MAG: outer membrane beta-barrel protein [Ginsengibacter sp.]